MTLAQQQELLARLLTEPGFSRQCDDTPAAVAEAYGLKIADFELFWAAEQERMALFRQTLLRKRWKQARSILGHASGMAPAELKAEFFRYAEAHSLTDPHVYTRDVCDFLAVADLPGPVAAVARLEYDIEEMVRTGQRCRLVHYAWPAWEMRHARAPWGKARSRTYWLWRTRDGILIRRWWGYPV